VNKRKQKVLGTERAKGSTWGKNEKEQKKVCRRVLGRTRSKVRRSMRRDPEKRKRSMAPW